jgi:hypothetical protein
MKVTVTAGPLVGIEGVFQGMDAQARVLVLLNLLGAQRPVALARDRVAAAH